MEETDRIDARILELEQEIIRLKVARNNLVPIRRVPAEIVLRIVKEAIGNDDEPMPLEWSGITSLCSWLRCLVISAAELWAYVDFSWNANLVDLHISRANACDLQFFIPFDLPEIDSVLKSISLHASRIRCLDYSWYLGTELIDVFHAIAVEGTSRLRRLRIRGCDMDYGLLPFLVFPDLVAMSLEGGREFDGFLSAPALRHLKLECSEIRLHELRNFLLQLPNLETIVLNQTHPSISEDGVWDPVSLLHLKSLHIVERHHSSLTRLLRISPTPSTHLFIQDRALSPLTWTSGDIGHIMRCPIEFWSKAMGGKADFPPGTIEVTLHEAVVTFNSQVDQSAWQDSLSPSLTLVFRCIVDQADPYLDLIHTLHLPTKTLGCVSAYLHIQHLRNVEHLIISGSVPWNTPHKAACIAKIETWLHSLRDMGRTLRSIEFRVPQTMELARSLFERWTAEELAHSMIWTKHEEDDDRSYDE
jgi:hypothetical protein